MNPELTELAAPIPAAQFIVFLRKVENLAGIAENQVVRLFFAGRQLLQLAVVGQHPTKRIQLVQQTAPAPLPLLGDTLGDHTFDGELFPRRVSAGGKGFEPRAQKTCLGEAPLRRRQRP